MPPKTNTEGQTYPWAIEGKDFAAVESYKFGYFLADFADMIGKKDAVGDYGSAIKNGMEDNPSIEEDIKQNKLVGGEISGVARIKVAGPHQGYSDYCTPEQREEVQANFDKMAKIAGETSAYLRGAYEGKQDAHSRHLQERADRIDLQTEVSNPKAGNITEAEFHAPYLYMINTEYGSAPKFNTKGLEECTRVLEQSGVEGGRNIFDDYMAVMTAGARETKVQYHRQQMEKGGWNAEKEATYLKELRSAHQITVDAYDRLWEVEDKGQYDSVLNNQLDHMVAKNPRETRDCNFAMGFIRGEMQAIDMGYDSHHLHALGRIGMQEQFMKRLEVQYTRQLAEENDPAKKQELQGKQDSLNAYKEEFGRMKESVWNKRVGSREEMEAVGKQVDDFFAAHQEKYADIQTHQRGHAAQFQYGKEVAATAEPLQREATGMTMDEFRIIGQTATTLTVQGIDEEAVLKHAELTGRLQSDLNGNLSPKSAEAGRKEAEGFLAKVDEKLSDMEKNPSQYKRAEGFQKALLNGQKAELSVICSGLPMGANSPYREKGQSHFLSIQAQLDKDCFQPQNMENTEKALQEFQLDEFAERFNQIQKRQIDFERNKDQMMPAERRMAYQKLQDGKREMIKDVKELQAKTANPSPELLTLFANKRSQLDDFRGSRGMQGIVDDYSLDLMKTDVPQAAGMDKAMEKFGTARAIVFKDESPEHKAMREAGEKLQANMKKLQDGTVTEEKEVTARRKGQDGKIIEETQKKSVTRPITEREREGLLKETWTSMKELERKTNQYISHATKNGTKLPHTPAGKARLAGAMEVQKLNGQFKEHLGKEPALEKIAAKDKLQEERTKKVGASGAEVLERMDQEVDKFRSMSQVEFHENSKDSMAYGLNECEYQAARVIAIASVEEAAMNGKVAGKDIMKTVKMNTDNIAKNPDFQKWIKDASKKGRMKDIGQMSTKDMRQDFINSMSKDMEKEAGKKEKTNAKTKAPAKTDKTKAPAKTEKTKAPAKTSAP